MMCLTAAMGLDGLQDLDDALRCTEQQPLILLRERQGHGAATDGTRSDTQGGGAVCLGPCVGSAALPLPLLLQPVLV
jgi:hypothetical protein